MSPNHELAAAEKPRLSVGYMRLTDSAPLIIARERGLFDQYGLDVTLHREVSWANIRDKVAVGALDAAPMLAPMPLLTAVGGEAVRTRMLTGLMLSLNGNAITLAAGLGDSLAATGVRGMPDPVAAARGLKAHIDRHRVRPILATVYPFSTHTFQLRLWLEAGGIDPDRDTRIIVLPPEQMVDNLARGSIDGFCVGEPWNSQAVQTGVGVVVAAGYQIWNNAPEKVLGVTTEWHGRYPATHLRLRLALMEAAAWLADRDNRGHAATIIAAPQYLNLPEKVVRPALIGAFQFSKSGVPLSIPDFLVFHRYQAGFPWRSRAEWLLRQSHRLLDKPISAEQTATLIQEAYRPDLYREAARLLGWLSPDMDTKTEGHHAAVHVVRPGVELGPDLMLGGATFAPVTALTGPAGNP
ncbi:MAG: CmpA/NrtA family ABC transporter substrate-binding protein [Porticoccaceae bacterium]